MFSNIGKKLKGLAVICFIVEALGSFVTGIVLLADDSVGLGFIIIIVGFLMAWVASWFLYGFGELVDKVCDIENNTRYSRAPVSLVHTTSTQATHNNMQQAAYVVAAPRVLDAATIERLSQIDAKIAELTTERNKKTIADMELDEQRDVILKLKEQIAGMTVFQKTEKEALQNRLDTIERPKFNELAKKVDDRKKSIEAEINALKEEAKRLKGN